MPVLSAQIPERILIDQHNSKSQGRAAIKAQDEQHVNFQLHSEPGDSPIGQNQKEGRMRCVFINIRCKPGQSYRVAEAIALREIHSELHSTSGPFDLLMKLYIPASEDIGKYINDNLLDIPDIERTETTLTFKAF